MYIDLLNIILCPSIKRHLKMTDFTPGLFYPSLPNFRILCFLETYNQPTQINFDLIALPFFLLIKIIKCCGGHDSQNYLCWFSLSEQRRSHFNIHIRTRCMLRSTLLLRHWRGPVMCNWDGYVYQNIELWNLKLWF